MNPQTHARLVGAYNIVAVAISLPVMIFFGYPGISGIGNLVPLFLYMLVIVAVYIIFWSLPVRCQRPNCWGTMKKTRTKTSTFRVELEYVCVKCGEKYELSVFEPPAGDPTP